jgi:hypothetical protein
MNFYYNWYFNWCWHYNWYFNWCWHYNWCCNWHEGTDIATTIDTAIATNTATAT